MIEPLIPWIAFVFGLMALGLLAVVGSLSRRLHHARSAVQRLWEAFVQEEQAHQQCDARNGLEIALLRATLKRRRKAEDDDDEDEDDDDDGADGHEAPPLFAPGAYFSLMCEEAELIRQRMARERDARRGEG